MDIKEDGESINTTGAGISNYDPLLPFRGSKPKRLNIGIDNGIKKNKDRSPKPLSTIVTRNPIRNILNNYKKLKGMKK